MNIKVSNHISRTNETIYVSLHKTCKCKCRLDASVCDNKQRWNKDKCRCECKELIDKGRCDEGFFWIPTKCEYECDKSCDVGQYLDYESCKCRKKLTDRLVEECSEKLDGDEMIYNTILNDHGKICSSCTIYSIIRHVFHNKYRH